MSSEGAGVYLYDVSLSFAGEDRDYVRDVADFLRNAGVRVFFDEYEEAELWGKNLYTHLDGVYRIDSQYCVIFISKHYAAKLWTNHERQSAQARAFKENSEYLLPARFDETEIPGIGPTVAYIDLRGRSPEQLANLIAAKIGSGTTRAKRDGKSVFDRSLIEERRRYWSSKDKRLWLVTLLIPAERVRCDFDPLCDGTVDALHDLDLPDYIADRITSKPNRYCTRSVPGRILVHEDLRRLPEGIGFRVEVQPNGLIEMAVCGNELLCGANFGEEKLRHGSASLTAVRALLPYAALAQLMSDQLRFILDLRQRVELPSAASILAVDLFGTAGLSLFVPGQWDHLVGYPLEVEAVFHEFPLQSSPDVQPLVGLVLRDLVNDFGLSLNGFKNERGGLIMPRLFAHG